MTVEKRSGLFTFNCDGPRCHANYESDDADFRAAWAEAQDDGWVNAINADDTWSHYCSKCKHIVGD